MTDTALERVPEQQKLPERIAGQSIAVNTAAGGISFSTMGEIVEAAKLMAAADVAVPKHLRRNPGACMAIVLQAVEWRMSPFAVANKSYAVNDRLCYESQLIHAVIEQRAPLAGRLRCKYFGEGEARKCLVYAKVKGEAEPFEYMSPEFGRIQPKNSPLWKTKPDLQLFYNASRNWARMYFPDVINGVYADDEFDAEVAARQPVQMPRAIESTVTGAPAPSQAPVSESDGGGAGDAKADAHDDPPGGDEQDPGGSGESQVDEILLPPGCNLNQITNLLIQRKPAAMSDATAEKLAKDFLRTSFPKKWEKLTRAVQEAAFKRWIVEGFPPYQAEQPTAPAGE